jgi:hypothetical protein
MYRLMIVLVKRHVQIGQARLTFEEFPLSLKTLPTYVSVTTQFAVYTSPPHLHNNKDKKKPYIRPQDRQSSKEKRR